MRLTFIGILALAMNAFAGTIAQTEDASPGADYHYGEIADPSLWPTSAVGAITVLLSSDRRAICTGTLVAPNLVLTAAHCLFNGKELVKPGNVRFLAGLNKASQVLIRSQSVLSFRKNMLRALGHQQLP